MATPYHQQQDQQNVQAPHKGTAAVNYDSTAAVAVPTEADVYTNLTARQQKEKVYPNNCSRYIVVFWSLLVLGLGIAAVSISHKQSKDIEDKIENAVLRLCKQCHHVTGLLLGAGITCIVGSALGLIAAWRRSKFFGCIFAIIQVICFLVFIAVAITATVLENDGINGHFNLDDLWKKAVEHAPDTICDVQRDADCTGYNHCCYFPESNSHILPAKNVTGNSVCYLITSNASAHYDYCKQWAVPKCSRVPDAPLCGPKLRHDVKKYSVYAEAIFFPLAFITFAVTWATKRMTYVLE